MSLCTGVGLFKRASVPALVFGKAMTSRIEDAWHMIATMRSKPEHSPSQFLLALVPDPAMDPALTQRNSTMGRGTTPQSVKQVVERCFFTFVELVIHWRELTREYGMPLGGSVGHTCNTSENMYSCIIASCTRTEPPPISTPFRTRS